MESPQGPLSTSSLTKASGSGARRGLLLMPPTRDQRRQWNARDKTPGRGLVPSGSLPRVPQTVRHQRPEPPGKAGTRV